ncbi:unnamed protein product [Schistocephalus solidus]|uniref:C2H2-type domain-containing protein n=1 Tax=Schistocephalus solidus TaxID=70667 RepID=A0A183TDB3_SCHSO|nr:unnamed protein product [Schistocephalus solidus]
MGLFGHMSIHDSGIHHNADITDTPSTPSAPAILTATATPTNMNDIPPASTDFSCPQCTRNFISRIGQVVHLESITRRLSNQCLGLRHTVAAPASTALTAPAHLHTIWAYEDTFASTTTCGKPPEAKPHQRTPSTLIHGQHPHNHHNGDNFAPMISAYAHPSMTSSAAEEHICLSNIYGDCGHVFLELRGIM